MADDTDKKPAVHTQEYVGLYELCKSMVETLRDSFRCQLVSLRDYVDTRFDSMDRATLLLMTNLEHRLDALNELRDVLQDRDKGAVERDKTYYTKDAHEQFATRIDADIRFLRESRALLEGKASQEELNHVRRTAEKSHLMAIAGAIIGSIGIILSIITFLER